MYHCLILPYNEHGGGTRPLSQLTAAFTQQSSMAAFQRTARMTISIKEPRDRKGKKSQGTLELGMAELGQLGHFCHLVLLRRHCSNNAVEEPNERYLFIEDQSS